MNRLFVYANSKQSHLRAMLYYFSIAFIWLWFTVGATTLFVHDFHVELYIARTLVGMFVGVAGFVISSLVTFKMPTRAR